MQGPRRYVRIKTWCKSEMSVDWPCICDGAFEVVVKASFPPAGTRYCIGMMAFEGIPRSLLHARLSKVWNF